MLRMFWVAEHLLLVKQDGCGANQTFLLRLLPALSHPGDGIPNEFACRVKFLSCSLAVSCCERVLIFGLPRTSQYRSPFEKGESNSSKILQLQNEELNM